MTSEEGARSSSVSNICTVEYKFNTKHFTLLFITLESGIDVGQVIDVGPGKFVKKNKRRALDTVQWKNPLAHSCSGGFCPQVI